MNEQPLQTLKGFRDIFPQEKRKRDYVQAKITEVFEQFGFEPLETPALEYADLLLGKYGQEADKLVYTFEDRGGRKVGLRYDQTVPTARILAQYRYNLPKFFRRYQVQNVFRADNPQQGRYREFTQCDIDIFDTSSPIADAEILACTYLAYRNIGFEQVIVKINDRQTLINTLKPYSTDQLDVFAIIQSIDKLDKLDKQEVTAELVKKGLKKTAAEQLLTDLQQIQPSSQLAEIIDLAQKLGVNSSALQFSPTLARGLDYYTGMIFEVIIPEYSAGSCGGGGRYDQLIEQLGGIAMPAVGFAFGFARTTAAADTLGLIPDKAGSAQVLVTIFDQKTRSYSLQTAQQLRRKGVSVEIYPEPDKLGKQFKLADQKDIPWVIVAGPEELEAEQVSLKNLESGQQEQLTLEEAVEKIEQ